MQPAQFDTGSFVADPLRECRAGITALRRLNAPGEEGLYYLLVGPPHGTAKPEHLRAALESGRPALRQAALHALPMPLPAEFREEVRSGLADDHPGVCAAAAAVAAKDKDASYRAPLLALLASERNIWALRSATGAALALDARYEATRAWAAQLDHPQHWHAALSELATIIIGPWSGSGTNTAKRKTLIALRERWERFLAQHEREIRKGRTFRPGDPALPENLFAPHLEIEVNPGERWPAKR